MADFEDALGRRQRERKPAPRFGVNNLIGDLSATRSTKTSGYIPKAPPEPMKAKSIAQSSGEDSSNYDGEGQNVENDLLTLV